jgi:type II secretory pathway pseudopilin PulG
MIELLIVITILGILAVAVLSAINPIEQINRGRDTGRQSDAEQLLSAIDRYNAFQGYYPWQDDADDTTTSIMIDDNNAASPTRLFDSAMGLPVKVTDTWPCADLDDPKDNACGAADCPIVKRLSTGDELIGDNCRGAQELKDSFITRVTDPDTRSLYVYNSGIPGSSTYVCFVPQSGAFDTQGSDRCANDELAGTFGNGLPEDVGAAARVFICDPATNRTGDGPDNAYMVCLP